MCCVWQANLAVQEAKLQVANNDLATAQATLDAKQKELDEVQAQFDAAMAEKQVDLLCTHGIPLPRSSCFCFLFLQCTGFYSSFYVPPPSPSSPPFATQFIELAWANDPG